MYMDVSNLLLNDFVSISHYQKKMIKKSLKKKEFKFKSEIPKISTDKIQIPDFQR